MSLEEKIRERIDWMVENGKTEKSPEEYWDDLMNTASTKFFYMKRDGQIHAIASAMGISIEDEGIGKEEVTYPIGDLPSLISEHSENIIVVKGKVLESDIKHVKKKSDGTELLIAECVVADKTGTARYSQFLSKNPGVDAIFHAIELDELDGKVISLKGVNVSKSDYSVHPVEIKLNANNGSIEITNESMSGVVDTVLPIGVKDAKSGDFNRYLLKIVKEAGGGTTKTGKTYKRFSCVDEDDCWVNLTFWFSGDFKDNLKLENGTFVTVDGRLKIDGYGNKLSVNRASDIVINPTGFNFDSSPSRTSLINAKVGARIEAIVFFNKIYKRRPFYLACPVPLDNGKDCRKGVKLDVDTGNFACGRGHVLSKKEENKIKKVGTINGIVSDQISIPFKMFDSNKEKSMIETISGLDIERIATEFDRRGDENFNEFFNELVRSRPFRVTGRVIADNYTGKLALSITDVEVFNIEDEIEAERDSMKVNV
jgi:hypothetical protein